MTNKILVANRGEIAIRIITAAIELGYETVAIYSDDQDKNHCLNATESIKLKSSSLFLNPQAIVDIAKSVHAVAIHPGYGFLSESTELADLCNTSGIVFIGPSASCISAVGDKVSARQVAKAAQVPVLPGSEHSVSRPDEVEAFGHQWGYPLMLKARDGGGGRGIRKVNESSEVSDALQRCINESPSKQVFVEKAIVGAKHIEVQVLGDHHGNIIHLFERDCSAQRRFQKIIEVAPCPSLSFDLRSKIHQAALQLARHIRYNSAGTVEFLVLPEKNEFYFLEVNPRIQVEHTISEQITSVDIVQAQIKIAFGESLKNLGLTQDTIQPNRLVSIQARVVAENPLNNNMLSVGKIKRVQFPQGHGIRVDTWIQPGSVILPTFDSLVAKIIVTGQSPQDALAKLKHALVRTQIEGIETNVGFLIAVLTEPDFLQKVDIQYLETHTPRLLQQIQPIPSLPPLTTTTITNPIQLKPGDAFNLELSGQPYSIQLDRISLNQFPDQFQADIQTSFSSGPVKLSIGRKQVGLGRKASGPAEVGSPLTGMLVEFSVQEGDRIEPGQALFVVSAMKMETVVTSVTAGVVHRIYPKLNELVEVGDVVIELSKESKL